MPRPSLEISCSVEITRTQRCMRKEFLKFRSCNISLGWPLPSTLRRKIRPSLVSASGFHFRLDFFVVELSLSFRFLFSPVPRDGSGDALRLGGARSRGEGGLGSSLLGLRVAAPEVIRRCAFKATVRRTCGACNDTISGTTRPASVDPRMCRPR